MHSKMECSIIDGEQEDWPQSRSERDPDEARDRLLEDELDAKIAPMELTGWSSDYYKLPTDATELQDLIEHKNMNFAVANVFKATYRLGEKPGTTPQYDLEKIIWFAQREMARLHRKEEDGNFEKVQSHNDDSTRADA